MCCSNMMDRQKCVWGGGGGGQVGAGMEMDWHEEYFDVLMKLTFNLAS